jgi:hypothetical protein
MHGRASLPSATIRNQYASAEAFPVFFKPPGYPFPFAEGGEQPAAKKDHAAISGKSMPF